MELDKRQLAAILRKLDVATLSRPLVEVIEQGQEILMAAAQQRYPHPTPMALFRPQPLVGIIKLIRPEAIILNYGMHKAPNVGQLRGSRGFIKGKSFALLSSANMSRRDRRVLMPAISDGVSNWRGAPKKGKRTRGWFAGTVRLSSVRRKIDALLKIAAATLVREWERG